MNGVMETVVNHQCKKSVWAKLVSDPDLHSE